MLSPGRSAARAHAKGNRCEFDPGVGSRKAAAGGSSKEFPTIGRRHGELLERLCGTCVLLLPAHVLAAGTEPSAPALQAPVGTGDILSVGASLILVVAAIVVCGWLYSRSQGLRVRGGGIINIIATQPLGPKERILLIEVADKQLVVGMTSTQVSTLHVFDEPVSRPVSRPDQRSNFGDRLKAILRGDAR